jgi:hypothetical protein
MAVIQRGLLKDYIPVGKYLRVLRLNDHPQ